MEQEFTEFRESDKSLKHELALNFKILSLKCVLLIQEVAGWQVRALLL